MDKLACLKFVIQNDGIEDAVKVAAVIDYIEGHDSDEEKLASFYEMENLYKEASLWGSLVGKIAPRLLRWGSKIAPKGAAGFKGWLGKGMTNLGNRGVATAIKSQGAAAAAKVAKGAAAAQAKALAGVSVGAAGAKGTAAAAKAAAVKAAAAKAAAAKAAVKPGALSRFFGWGAKHPGMAGGAIALGSVGAGLGAGAIYGGMRENDAYKRGYGTATSQVGPMLAASMGRRGAMGMQNIG